MLEIRKAIKFVAGKSASQLEKYLEYEHYWELFAIALRKTR